MSSKCPYRNKSSTYSPLKLSFEYFSSTYYKIRGIWGISLNEFKRLLGGNSLRPHFELSRIFLLLLFFRGCLFYPTHHHHIVLSYSVSWIRGEIGCNFKRCIVHMMWMMVLFVRKPGTDQRPCHLVFRLGIIISMQVSKTIKKIIVCPQPPK